MVAVRAADEFVTAIGIFYEPRIAEGGDELLPRPKNNETGTSQADGFFYFHAASMTEGVGHWRSMQKINRAIFFAAGKQQPCHAWLVGGIYFQPSKRLDVQTPASRLIQR